MRYLPLTEADRRDMLAAIGVPSVDACSPTCRRRRGSTACSICRARWASSRSSADSRRWRRRTSRAGSVPFFLGAGAYRHHVPAAVDHLIQRGEFLTSYTPYQPEVTQGTLQYLFEFQTQVALMTGMEVANASLYDGATACAEAVMMAEPRDPPRQGGAVGRPPSALPRGDCETYARFVGFELAAQRSGARRRRGPRRAGRRRYLLRRRPEPGFLRRCPGLLDAGRGRATQAGALLVVVVTEIVSLGAIKPPGEMGADIVAAEGQSFGNALNFGGPHVGLFATPREVRPPDAGPPGRRRPSTPKAGAAGC